MSFKLDPLKYRLKLAECYFKPYTNELGEFVYSREIVLSFELNRQRSFCLVSVDEKYCRDEVYKIRKIDICEIFADECDLSFFAIIEAMSLGEMRGNAGNLAAWSIFYNCFVSKTIKNNSINSGMDLLEKLIPKFLEYQNVLLQKELEQDITDVCIR